MGAGSASVRSVKLREYNRWLVPIFGFGSALNLPTIAFIQTVGGGGGLLPPGVDVLALVWTVLAAGCVAVLTFGVPLPPAWRMGAALLLAAAVGICGVFAVSGRALGFLPGAASSLLLSGCGLAVIAVGMAGTVLHPEPARARRV